MPNDLQKLKQLLEQPDWSKEEEDWLMSYIGVNGREALEEILLQQYNKDIDEGSTIDDEVSQLMRRRIFEKMDLPDKPASIISIAKPRRSKWIAAAIISGLLVGSGLFYLLTSSQRKQTGPLENPMSSDIVAGGNKALLKLADGTIITLDSLADGTIAQQGAGQIIKEENALSYADKGSEGTGITWNTLSTPNSGQYRITLSDGTSVWLNSATSLKFPVAFNQDVREVELKGEAYFEVAKSSKPFFVVVNGMKVTVLGTHFNVMAYSDEPQVKTVLLEGAVKLLSNMDTVLLKPGKQGAFSAGRNFEVKEVDVEEAVAWKNGFFQFTESGIEPIMRQVKRWYDVDIVYAGQLKEQLYTGSVSRKDNLSELLKMLEGTGTIRFKLDKRTIYVSQ